jgi:hypothetical protein
MAAFARSRREACLAQGRRQPRRPRPRHAKERQRPRFNIQFPPAHRIEAAGAVEGAGGPVLLVHLDGEVAEPLRGVTDEEPANAAAMRLGLSNDISQRIT